MRISPLARILTGILISLGLAGAEEPAPQDAHVRRVHKNVIYGMHGGLALLMDVYKPAESNGHALLFIAGSGWHWPTTYGAGGIKDAVTKGGLGGGSVEVFANAGFTVFVINHRQAPLFRYPAAVEDARRAVRYIRHHGNEYGVTKEAVAAFGISSGAHLVLMLALADGPGDPESADEIERHSSKVDVVAAYAGPTDLTAEDWVESIGASYVASFVGAPLGGFAGGTHAEASPITHVDGDDPPVLLLHGEADDVVPVSQSRSLALRLREHEVDVEYVEIADGGHDFDKVLNHDPNELPSFPAMARWLREHLPAGARHIDHYFDSDGVRIRYIDAGPRDGEPVVLVHGFSQSIESAWGSTGAIDHLDDEHRVIALDLRGHGKSDKPHDPDAYGNEMVGDIVRLLDHLDIWKTHVVGYSMGGRVVAKLVADHPERVKSALPCGTNMEPGSEDDKALGERMALSLKESGSIRPALEHFITDGSMTEEQIEQIVTMVRETNDTKALAAVVRSVDELLPDREKLETNHVPCLSIIGEHDPNLTNTKKTAQYMANFDLEVLPDENHITAFQSTEFIAAVKAFLSRHGDTAKRTAYGLAHAPFPEAQAEIRAVLAAMRNDAETANVQGLRDVHLDTQKFTKFGGGSDYKRMDYETTVEAETAAITSVEAYESEMRDLKIDVFGDVAVVTYYPHRRVTTDGEVRRYSTRQTLVFLRAPDGWKIVHEHQSGRNDEE